MWLPSLLVQHSELLGRKLANELKDGSPSKSQGFTPRKAGLALSTYHMITSTILLDRGTARWTHTIMILVSKETDKRPKILSESLSYPV